MTKKQNKTLWPRRKKDVKIGKSFWIVIIFLGVYFLGNVWQSVSINRLNRQNSQLHKEYVELEQQYNLLVQDFEEKRQLNRVLAELQPQVRLVPVEVIHLESN